MERITFTYREEIQKEVLETRILFCIGDNFPCKWEPPVIQEVNDGYHVEMWVGEECLDDVLECLKSNGLVKGYVKGSE
jgi:hypothetical protein